MLSPAQFKAGAFFLFGLIALFSLRIKREKYVQGSEFTESNRWLKSPVESPSIDYLSVYLVEQLPISIYGPLSVSEPVFIVTYPVGCDRM